MINQKACDTCEHWDFIEGGYGGCMLCDSKYTIDTDLCDHWAPRHGEWIRTALAKPDDKELVAIHDAGKIMLAVYSASRKAFITEKGWLRSHEDCIKWWMRFEEVPNDPL